MKTRHLPLLLALVIASVPCRILSNDTDTSIEKPPRRIVVSGFEPFGGLAHNASYLFATALAKAAKGRVELVQVPVVWGAPKQSIETVAGGKPIDLWVAFGEGKSHAFWLETIANNERSAAPDNTGQKPSQTLIDSSGPAKRQAAADQASALINRLRQQDLSVNRSSAAGRYLCEEMLYQLLAHSEGDKALIKVAHFIHLPVLGQPYTDADGRTQPFTADLCADLALRFWQAMNVVP